MKNVHEHIALQRSKYVKYDNDGVFCSDEMKWGDHIGHFNADHAELVGLRLNSNILPYYRRIHENIKENVESC